MLGPTFYQLRLLFDKHAEEQQELVDLLAERIQSLGGVVVAMPDDVAEMKSIARPPAGAEPPAVQFGCDQRLWVSRIAIGGGEAGKRVGWLIMTKRPDVHPHA